MGCHGLLPQRVKRSCKSSRDFGISASNLLCIDSTCIVHLKILCKSNIGVCRSGKAVVWDGRCCALKFVSYTVWYTRNWKQSRKIESVFLESGYHETHNELIRTYKESLREEERVDGDDSRAFLIDDCVQVSWSISANGSKRAFS